MRNQLKSLPRFPNLKQSLRKIPENAGIYIFWQKNTPIYIGKAVNLKSRLNSYFAVDLAPKTSKMVSEADTFSFIVVGSELEALLLEAKLIRANKPRYNFALKDDKHPLYIKITKEKYPRVLTSRKIEESEKVADFFGPFPSSTAVRGVLKMVRKIFPFSDHKIGKRPCLYSHIGLCNPCPNAIELLKDGKNKELSTKKYRKNIARIRKILRGEMTSVRNDLNKEMREFSANEAYEEAAFVRSQVQRLDYITQPVTDVSRFLQNPNLAEDIREQELQVLTSIISKHVKLPGKISRIECFDVAHLTGTFPTASMVTFIKGEVDKSFYRHFRIRQTKGQDDISSMREVARRRAANLRAWGKPDLIVVDGGKAQVNAFRLIFDRLNIPVVGLAKMFETLIIPSDNGFAQIALSKGSALNLLQRIRNEAHRFARMYHHKLVKKSLVDPFGKAQGRNS